MSLFRNENPNLGPATTVNEIGLTSASSSAVAASNFKPTTREMVDFQYNATSHAAGGAQYIYVAPWSCQVVAIRHNLSVVSTSGVIAVQKINADAKPPVIFASADANRINLTTAAIDLSAGGVGANTRNNVALSTAAGALVLNPGDQIGVFISGTLTGLVGASLQVEVTQLG